MIWDADPVTLWIRGLDNVKYYYITYAIVAMCLLDQKLGFTVDQKLDLTVDQKLGFTVDA